MDDVEAFLIGNMYHNYEHNPSQNGEAVATNIGEKSTQKSCGCRNVQPLVYHDIVARLRVEKDRQAHTREFVEKVNHHAN
jgi:hypothetical protein